MDLNRSKPAQTQDVHRERFFDAVAIQHADQVVDALDVNAIELDDDVARQKPGLRRRTIRLDLHQQRAHLVFDASNHRMPPRDRRGLAGHADIGTPDIARAGDLRQDELRGIARDRKADALSTIDNRSIDADYFGIGRDQRPTGIAGIERGVGLYHVFDDASAYRADRPAEC